jgi:hypothetical protein
VYSNGKKLVDAGTFKLDLEKKKKILKFFILFLYILGEFKAILFFFKKKLTNSKRVIYDSANPK